MRVVTQGEEVFDRAVVAILFGDARALRLVNPEPLDRLVEAVETIVRMQAGVADDAKARAAGAEGNQPHPVAHSHQVVGAVPAGLVGHARFPGRVSHPVVEAHAALDAPPARVRQVRDLPRQAQAAPHQATASAGIDKPSSRDRPGSLGGVDLDAMMRIAELEILDGCAIEDVDPHGTVRFEQPVLQAAAVELKRRHRRERRRSELESAPEVTVVAGGKEVAQTELLEVAGAQVVLDVEHLLHVVRADLDRRLADLVGGLRRRMGPLLGDQDLQRWRRSFQLPRQRQPGQSTAGNEDVNVHGRHYDSGGCGSCRDRLITIKRDRRYCL